MAWRNLLTCEEPVDTLLMDGTVEPVDTWLIDGVVEPVDTRG